MENLNLALKGNNHSVRQNQNLILLLTHNTDSFKCFQPLIRSIKLKYFIFEVLITDITKIMNNNNNYNYHYSTCHINHVLETNISATHIIE